jgi:hypothetical protein
MNKRFSIEIDAEELAFILTGYSERRARRSVEMRRLKGEQKMAMQVRIDTDQKRYDALDLLLDQHATPDMLA